MRDLLELDINEGGEPIRLPASTDVEVAASERHFNPALPSEYLKFLRRANGGHPKLSSILPIGGADEERLDVNRFRHLAGDHASPSNWAATAAWRDVLGPKALPFASDGGGYQFFFDLTGACSTVKIWMHERIVPIKSVASSFEESIDNLSTDQDAI
jgi:hypothetical protein